MLVPARVRVPEAPVGCTPNPIRLASSRDLTISWLSQAESALVLDWAEEQKAKKASKAAAATARQQQQEEERAKGTGTGSANTAAAQLVAAAGLREPRLSSSSSSSSSSGSSMSTWPSSMDEVADDIRRDEGRVPLLCDHAPFPFHRSSGLEFQPPARMGAGGGGGGGCASKAATAVAPPPQGPGVAAAAAELPTTQVPVGMDYYLALQKAWSRRPENPPKLPPLASEAEVNLSDIDDVLSGDSDYEELNPPVPLGLMISYFAEDWQESGLYDVVQRREDATASQGQKK